MQFTTENTVITVTYESRVFGNNTLDKSICIKNNNKEAMAASIARVESICSSTSVHKATYLERLLAVLKDVSGRSGFDEFDGAYLVDELIVLCQVRQLQLKMKKGSIV